MKNGWHVVAGHDIYVEDDRVIYGMKRDYNGSLVRAYPYRVQWRYSLGKRYEDGWIDCSGISVSAF